MYRLKEGKISSYGIFSLLAILIITKAFLGIPRVVAQEAGSAAWLLLLLSGFVSTAGIYLIVKLVQRFPGKNLVEIAEIVWGGPGRVFVSLTMAILFLYISTVVVREFSETILTTVLPRTPISIITLMFLITMIFGSYKGLEAITRSSVLLFPFIIIGILSILFLTGSFIDLNNLFPVLGKGLKIVTKIPGRTSIFIDIIFVTLIASNVNEPEKIPAQIWKSFFMSIFLFVIIEIVYVSVLSLEAATKLYIPLFQLARIIYMGRFFQRIEALYVFIWFFAGALKLTLSFYGAVVTLCRGFKIPIYQPLLFPAGLLVFAISFLPPNMAAAISLDVNFLGELGSLIGFGLPAAILVTAVFRRKGGKQNEK